MHRSQHRKIWRARWVEPSIAALRRWVQAARGSRSEPYALDALAARLKSEQRSPAPHAPDGGRAYGTLRTDKPG